MPWCPSRHLRSFEPQFSEGKYAHPVTISLSIPGVCLENEQELPGSDGTQRREDLLGILPTRPQSRLYHVTDPSEFLQ
ncbi:hypothetical protein YC2023_091040 [Brassica napus]